MVESNASVPSKISSYSLNGSPTAGTSAWTRLPTDLGLGTYGSAASSSMPTVLHLDDAQPLAISLPAGSKGMNPMHLSVIFSCLDSWCQADNHSPGIALEAVFNGHRLPIKVCVPGNPGMACDENNLLALKPLCGDPRSLGSLRGAIDIDIGHAQTSPFGLLRLNVWTGWNVSEGSDRSHSGTLLKNASPSPPPCHPPALLESLSILVLPPGCHEAAEELSGELCRHNPSDIQDLIMDLSTVLLEGSRNSCSFQPSIKLVSELSITADFVLPTCMDLIAWAKASGLHSLSQLLSEHAQRLNINYQHHKPTAAASLPEDSEAAPPLEISAAWAGCITVLTLFTHLFHVVVRGYGECQMSPN